MPRSHGDAIAGGGRGRAPQSGRDIDPRAAPRGRERSQDGGECRRDNTEQQHPAVHGDLVRAWHDSRHEVSNRRRDRDGDEHAGEGSGRGEHDAFGQQLTNEPRPIRAERSANGQLLPSFRHAHQHGVRHRRARYRKQEARDVSEKQQGRTRLSDHPIVDPLNAGNVSVFNGNARVVEMGANGGHSGRRVLE